MATGNSETADEYIKSVIDLCDNVIDEVVDEIVDELIPDGEIGFNVFPKGTEAPDSRADDIDYKAKYESAQALIETLSTKLINANIEISELKKGVKVIKEGDSPDPNDFPNFGEFLKACYEVEKIKKGEDNEQS